jgi:hypothetical protein
METSLKEGLKKTDDRGFLVAADISALMPPNDMATFLPMTLQCSNLHNSVNHLLLKVIAKHNVKSILYYTLHITNGVGKPYIGY